MTTLLRDRWQAKTLIGDAQHVLIVRVRKGFMKAGYLNERRIDHLGPDGLGSPIYPPLIWKGNNHDCFKKAWTPVTDWQEVPNIQNVKWSRSFDVQTGGEQGAATCTIVMDNIEFVDKVGVGGMGYHTIDRGYFSPARGIHVNNRPKRWPGDAKNHWQNVFNAGWQVEIWEGYGTGSDVQLKDELDENHSYAPDSGALARTYTGIITDCDQDSHPDHITITAQDFSIFLTDQRIAGWNKALEVPSPVTFADRKRTQGELMLKGPYHASSGTVTEDGDWKSQAHTDPTDTSAWIEVDMPQGYYEEFFVSVVGRHSAFVSIKIGPGGGSLDRVHPVPAGWLDSLSGPGTGTVDGIPYFRKITIADSPARRWGFGHGIDVPDGSKLRLTFTNLPKNDDGNYYAQTDAFAVYKFGVDPNHPPKGTPATKAKGWILVEDASDVVRMIFIWAGFQEWHVPDLGWSLYQAVHFGADQFLIDPIKAVAAQSDYVFYMGPPTADDRSIGVPHFEPMNALSKKAAGLEVKDTTMTEALSVKWDLSNLPEVVRYLGAITKKGGGQVIGFGIQGMTRRYVGVYYPPWSGHHQPIKVQGGGLIYTSTRGVRRNGSVNRCFMQTMGTSTYTQLQSNAECLMAAVLAAIQYALNMCTGQFQIPGIMPINLNSLISVVDEAAAVNSRMWVASIESDHVMGGGSEVGHWQMTVGGAMIDTQDMMLLRNDYDWAWRKGQPKKAQLASVPR